jgi:hypothetical protein
MAIKMGVDVIDRNQQDIRDTEVTKKKTAGNINVDLRVV